MIYYLYTHTRLDKNVIFYVGIGRSKTKTYKRAYQFSKNDRNTIWTKIYEKLKGNIRVDIIKVFDNIKDCQDAEIYLIKVIGRKIDETGPLANLSSGGEISTKDPQKVLQYSKDGEFIKVCSSTEQAAQECNVNYSALHHAIKAKGTSGGYQWRWYTKNYPLVIEGYKNPNQVEVYQFTKDCIFIASYLSIAKAASILKIDQYSISNTIAGRGKRVTAGGFIWTKDRNACAACLPKRRIDQYSLTGKFIRSYNTLEEIKKQLKITSSTCIRQCFSGKSKQSYGFIWRDNRF